MKIKKLKIIQNQKITKLQNDEIHKINRHSKFPKRAKIIQ